MYGKGQRHIRLFGRLHKADQILQGRVLVMMATAARIGQFVDPSRFQAGKRHHDLKVVTEYPTDFCVLGDSRHVTADTIGKGMDGMGILVCIPHVTGQTLPGSGTHSLELCRR